MLKRGAAFHAGQVVLAAGKRLGPLDVALLAEIGQAEVAAYPRPRVGVLPTGDELVGRTSRRARADSQLQRADAAGGGRRGRARRPSIWAWRATIRPTCARRSAAG